MTPNTTLNQTIKLISSLIEVGLSDDQNYPSISNLPENISEVTIPGNHDFSISLKNISYREIYETLEAGRSYHIRMIDGGLIQILYRFKDQNLMSHRLCYFPSPDFEAFQNDPDVYLTDPIYGDILQKSIMPFPVRFDFNLDDKLHVEIDHPKSHMTLGQYTNCRIPVSAPLTPHTFLSFILNSFYKCATKSFDSLPRNPNIVCTGTLTDNELKTTHLSLMP
jgi:hypothetical protein